MGLIAPPMLQVLPKAEWVGPLLPRACPKAQGTRGVAH